MAQASTAITSGLDIPETLEQALDPQWLAAALVHTSGGSPVIAVELDEVVQAMAAKVRIAVRFANDPERQHFYCVKGFLDTDQDRQSTGEVTTRESNFYTRIAPHLSMRVPGCPSVVTDDSGQAIMIMEDVIAAGGHFCHAHEPFSVEQVQATLDQLARLHAASHLLESNPWIPRGIDWMAESKHFPESWIHKQMHDPRGEGLPESTLDGSNLLNGLRALGKRSDASAATLLHGDTHIANIYMTPEGPGFADWQLIKGANWALDIAYHINGVLPVELAEKHERELVAYYLGALGRHGGSPPDMDTAWEDYCCAPPYGLYLWAVTTRVDPAITTKNFQRLGAALTRCESYQRLGIIS
ncbi:aminoglycoside phosphotransferase family protein [Mangrovimicrobium sediminis]|uniref:Aminoglycoside phosphotransferase family protein n=1 Tax=Mangrovimicrobium sediminis TaxID=2562682 RepID=A0A4Z0LVK8_9GAMM|nr:phosphotransferase [Haliea sp. SAOS-164]TGD71274.1 aminoglycoside phosphotransferase family protein [Haliea sp. SAOS-164]